MRPVSSRRAVSWRFSWRSSLRAGRTRRRRFPGNPPSTGSRSPFCLRPSRSSRSRSGRRRSGAGTTTPSGVSRRAAWWLTGNSICLSFSSRPSASLFRTTRSAFRLPGAYFPWGHCRQPQPSNAATCCSGSRWSRSSAKRLSTPALARPRRTFSGPSRRPLLSSGIRSRWVSPRCRSPWQPPRHSTFSCASAAALGGGSQAPCLASCPGSRAGKG
jgi:hypothetical protein